MGWKRDRRRARRKMKKTGELYGSASPINVPPLPDRDTMLKKQSQLVNMKKVKMKGNGNDAITIWPT